MSDDLPMKRDPVCGRYVAEDRAPQRTEFEGTTYVFCSESCRSLFSVRPAWFAEGDVILARRQP